ncbi:lysophospholipid acyltransferase 7 [Osmia bicornis bicornis]|uniref:lysophospholipid acyltransferase 7 n=1 Tax=Osmia bicornis bicornis TaxID=1437191 RepID=UPI0010F9DE0C|nr:lysophospholipid acyltransferase 7 [Osmia bicornis bicornis]
MWADVIYVATLLFSVVIGFYYRQIDDPQVKKWMGTLIGFVVARFVSGKHILHLLFSTLINAIIITKLSPKVCHVISICFSFFYLIIIFRLGEWVGLPTPPTHTNLILMIMTLKLSGLAFEVNSATNPAPGDPEGVSSEALKNVGFLDVFHYAFSYMGLLTGPYYRYRTYWDHIYRPLTKYVDGWPPTLYKLKLTGIFIILYFIMNTLYPSKYILTDEFAERTFLYKHLYMYPTFAVFRLRMYIGMTLAECACQMAGLGAYPKKCKPLQGLGPKDYKTIEALSATPEELKNEEFSFDTIHNMDVMKLETCQSVRTAMKAWNGCIQYWMGVYVYKRFPVKCLRTIVTLTLSAVWHGWAPGYFFCICQIPLFMLTDDIAMKFYNQSEENSLAKKAWYMLLWYEKTTCMAYLGVSFLLLGFRDTMHYYRVVYFSGHIVALLLYVTVLCLKPYVLKRTVESKDKEK